MDKIKQNLLIAYICVQEEYSSRYESDLLFVIKNLLKSGEVEMGEDDLSVDFVKGVFEEYNINIDIEYGDFYTYKIKIKDN
jgi:hypothetical protein